jgi:hypothetical protein
MKTVISRSINNSRTIKDSRSVTVSCPEKVPMLTLLPRNTFRSSRRLYGESLGLIFGAPYFLAMFGSKARKLVL